MFTVLAKTHRGSGRPDSFEVVKANDQKAIDRLIQGYQFYILADEKEEGYSVGDAWTEYTYQDNDGFTQWRRADECLERTP